MDIENMPIDIQDIPEIEENEFHPMNDQFNREIKHVKSIIMAHQRAMTPKHVRVIKMKFTGATNVSIAEAVGYADATVGIIVNSQNGQRLLNLLTYIDAAMAGPTAAHRLAILNRIIVRNEEANPKVALQAIAEMNKMDMNDHAKDQDDTPATTNITINQNYFPKTPLDG
jgi:hypothetical protein